MDRSTTITLNVHLHDAGGITSRDFTDFTTPFVSLDLTNTISLLVHDMDVLDALQAAITEARRTLEGTVTA